MPVYIRKEMIIPPPSAMAGFLSDEGDFISDPEQMRDPLPQPYRMINKIVYNVLEEAWDIAQNKEEQRLLELSRIRPPQYDCGVQMQLYGRTGCLTESKDGNYVFIGLPDGLAVIDASNHQSVVMWEEERTEIVSIKTGFIGGHEVYLLATVDDMGIARVFAFAGEKLFLLKTMNEPQEGSPKIIATKCEASDEGDYIGVALEKPNSLERWLEIYKKPENWVKELEALKSQSPRQAMQPPKAPTPHLEEEKEAPIEVSHPSEGMVGSVPADEQSPRSQSPGSTDDSAGLPASAEKQSYKFSVPTLVLKVKGPNPSIQHSTASTVYQGLSKIDQGDVIGSGQAHIITASHLELRKNVFELLHEQHMKYLPSEEEQVILPSFHFLLPGRMLPVGLENSGVPSSVAVRWSEGTQLMHYSLLKTAKDVEHKPDLVWPFACAITATTTTQDTSMMAIGLENGTVAVMDIRMGIQRRVVNVSSDSKVRQMIFLNPNICPQESLTYPPYPCRTSFYLLVVCENGMVCLVNTSLGDSSSPICVLPKADTPNEMPVFIEPLVSCPEIIMTVYRDGTIFLHDILKRLRLCEVCLPPAYELTAPWEPILTLAAKSQMLYMKGTKLEPEAEEVKESNIFAFPLRSFPILDDYWKKEREEIPYSVHTTVNNRLESMLRERITHQPFRQVRMQMRWEKLKDELEILQKIRDEKKDQPKKVYAESTIADSDEERPDISA